MCTFHFNVSHFDGICHSIGVIMRTTHSGSIYLYLPFLIFLFLSVCLSILLLFLIHPYFISIFIYQSIYLSVLHANVSKHVQRAYTHSLTLILLAMSTLLYTYRPGSVETHRCSVCIITQNNDKSNWFSCVLTKINIASNEWSLFRLLLIIIYDTVFSDWLRKKQIEWERERARVRTNEPLLRKIMHTAHYSNESKSSHQIHSPFQNAGKNIYSFMLYPIEWRFQCHQIVCMRSNSYRISIFVYVVYTSICMYTKFS